MTRFLTYCLIVAVLVIAGQCVRISGLKEKTDKAVTPDTVIITKPYVPMEVRPDNVPVKVKEYLKKDTTLRKQREKQDIIENIDVKKNDKGQVTEIDITKTDTTGQVTEEIHKTDPDSKEVEIGNQGQVHEKKKTKAGKILKKIWKGTKIGLMAVGTVTVLIITAEHF